MSIREEIQALPELVFKLDDITIREIKTEEDLGYATVIFKLKAKQESLVNPTGFSI